MFISIKVIGGNFNLSRKGRKMIRDIWKVFLNLKSNNYNLLKFKKNILNGNK